MSINILCGLTFVEPASGDSSQAMQTNVNRKTKLNLIPRRQSSAIFLVIQDEEPIRDDNNIQETSTVEKITDGAHSPCGESVSNRWRSIDVVKIPCKPR